MTGIKMLGAMMLIICGSLGGIYKSEIIKKQVKFLKEYIVFMTQAETMISYCGLDISQILRNTKSLTLINNMFNDCLKSMKNGEDFCNSWCYAVQAAYNRKEIRKCDCSMICNFAETFGVSGIEEEIGKIQMHKSIAKKVYEQQNMEIKSKTALCRTIGIFFGTMAAIILV